MTRDAQIPRYRRVPDCVVLPGKSGASAGGRPPVRIFLGTEDGQWRAERIFVYAIEQVRDPDRSYEIHLMKNLDGFDRRGWRTGFTNYRYAVPEFAGFEGRVIYNDVDQIYLADPADLFDLELNGHGYLSVSAEDTSVMLVDCTRMAAWWTRDKAVRGKKSQLMREPAAQPGLWGRLAGGWNARDLEYTAGEARVLHFTALHLQPWQPFPENYSYRPHPLGDLWLDLERRADRDGYEVFRPNRPSAQFPAALHRASSFDPREVADLGAAWLRDRQAREVLAVTAGDRTSTCEYLTDSDFDVHSCSVDELGEADDRYDAVAAVGTLEQCPAEDVPWLIESMFSRAARVWIALECCGPPDRDAHVDVTRAVRPLRWWRQQIGRVAGRHPLVSWQLNALSQKGATTTLCAEALSDREPSVWILEGLRTGDNTQLRRLSEALGWPVERKPLKFNKLHVLPNFVLGASCINLRSESRRSLAPPWPDLVIAFGKRSASTARRIKKKSGGRTRLIHLGRPWARFDAFDLVVTTPQYRLPARENVQHNRLPLTFVTRKTLAQRREAIEQRFEDLPRPRVALVIGGDSWSYTFGPDTARRLGESASRGVRETDGALLVVTSPRTARRSADALFAAIDAPHCAHRYDAGQRVNPYVDYLAVADEILVTGDSASMIADAVATGRPVEIIDLPRRLPGRLSTAIAGYAARLRGKTYRGTPRQQGPLQRFLDSLTDRGFITPPRDLGKLHRMLALQGMVAAGKGRNAAVSDVCGDELANTAARVKQLFVQGRFANSHPDAPPVCGYFTTGRRSGNRYALGARRW